MSVQSIRVCLSPALLPYHDMDNTVAVVIDIFRATSSMCYGFANGAHAIIPVAEIDECLAYREKGYLLAAERDGEVVGGFDFGNSPFSYTREKVEGQTIVLTTTNGTRAIRQCEEASAVVVGSFLNISILADWLKNQHQHVLLVCAGWKNRFSLEDSVFAGALVNRLKTDGIALDDAAYATERLFLEAQHDLPGYLSHSSHSERMKQLHIENDIAFCLQYDLAPVVPIMHQNQLVCATLTVAPAS